MATKTRSSLHDFIDRVARRDMSWMKQGACRASSPQVVEMFTCLEDDVFVVKNGMPVLAGGPPAKGQRTLTGLEIQRHLVDAYCNDCPVQWECAYWAFEVEERFDRSTGAWAMVRRDRRWLALQPDPFGIISRAKIAGIPVHVAIANARRRKG